MRWLRTLLPISVVMLAAVVAAQVPEIGETRCVGGCGSSSGSSGSNSGGRPVAPLRLPHLPHPAHPLHLPHPTAHTRSTRTHTVPASHAPYALSETRAESTLHISQGSTPDFDGRIAVEPAPILEFMPGPSAAPGPPPSSSATPGCGPVTDPTVVNLCNAGTDVVDPNRVKGVTPPAAAQTLEFMRDAPNSTPGGAGSPVDSAVARASAFAYASPEERQLGEEVDRVLQTADSLVDMAAQAIARGDVARAEQLNKALSDALPTIQKAVDRDVQMREERLRQGMTILLQDPAYAASWKSVVAQVHMQEMAEFARQNAELAPEQQRIIAVLRKSGGSPEVNKQQQELDDKLREAQVLTLRRSTKELDASAQDLLLMAASAH